MRKGSTARKGPRPRCSSLCDAAPYHFASTRLQSRNNLRRQLMRESKPCIAPIVSCSSPVPSEGPSHSLSLFSPSFTPSLSLYLYLYFSLFLFLSCALSLSLCLPSRSFSFAEGRLNNIIGGVLTVPGRPRANMHPSRNFAHAGASRALSHGSAKRPDDGTWLAEREARVRGQLALADRHRTTVPSPPKSRSKFPLSPHPLLLFLVVFLDPPPSLYGTIAPSSISILLHGSSSSARGARLITDWLTDWNEIQPLTHTFSTGLSYFRRCL